MLLLFPNLKFRDLQAPGPGGFLSPNSPLPLSKNAIALLETSSDLIKK